MQKKSNLPNKSQVAMEQSDMKFGNLEISILDQYTDE